MKTLRLVLIAALVVPSSAAFAADAPVPAEIVVKVYHTNDVHGWIMSRPDKLQAGRALGGAAALKALIDRETGPKLVLDGGDWWQGTPEGSLTKGEGVARVFNAIGYDAIEVGNHEFDSGTESLRNLVPKLSMPVLAANLYGPDGKHAPWLKQRLVKEVAGVKFGIFGLVTSHLKGLVQPNKLDGYTVRREVDEARDQVKALKKEGAEVIIAVTHVGFETPDKPKFEGDQTLAAEVEGIDLIVGGHTHTPLSRAWRDPVHGTLVVQAGSYLVKAGRTTLKIDKKTHHVVASSDELLELWPDRVGEESGVKAIVAKLDEEVGQIFSVIVATAPADLPRGPGIVESVLGSWMTDCLRDWAGTDVAFMNGGGIRADLPSGAVTVRRLFEILPFDDVVVKAVMKGDVLRDAVDDVTGTPRGIQVSGMTLETQPLKPRHERLKTMTVGGAPVDPAKTYTVATLDFVAETGADFARAESQERTGTLGRDVFRQCAEKQKIIVAPAPGRMKPVEN